MKKFEGKTWKEYEVYAKKRRSKSIIATTVDKLFMEYRKKHNFADVPMLNGFIDSDSAKNPYMYECVVGDGYVEDGKTYMTSNYYTINFYSGIKGVTIYKALEQSIHYRCFTCGGSPDIFGYNFFSAECRVYEELTVEEILKKLVNKNWLEYKNITKNKTNIMFLKLMKQRLIKTLEYNKVIYKRENGTYEDYKYFGKLK